MKKKGLALLLVIGLIFSAMPQFVMAGDEPGNDNAASAVTTATDVDETADEDSKDNASNKDAVSTPDTDAGSDANSDASEDTNDADTNDVVEDTTPVATIQADPEDSQNTQAVEDPTLRAQAENVTVTFDAKGGTPVPAQTFEAGGKATKPTDPTKSGWETEGIGCGFDGWYTDENYSNEFDFNTEVEKDITLYARWNGWLGVYAYDKTNSKNISGGTIACENVEESIIDLAGYGNAFIAEGTAVTVTAKPDEGYRFVGWAKGSAKGTIVSTSAHYEFTFTENPTELYALFAEEGKVTVTFDTKGGTPAPEAQVIVAGSKATKPEDPTKSGWDTDPMGGFDGWYTDETYSTSAKFDFNTPVDKDITLYARWNGRVNVWAYDKTNGVEKAGGTFACESIEDSVENMTEYGNPWIAEDTKVTVTATPASGYRFMGWAKGSASGTIVSTDASYTFTFTENPTELYALFVDEEDVIVTFDAKGGTPEPAAQNFKAGGKATKPSDPTKSGWEPETDSYGGGFDGWYTDENYSNEFDFNTEVEKDITLYARWNGRVDVNAYDPVKEEIGGGTIACENVEESVTDMTQYGCPCVAEGTTVTVKATPDEGYRFVAWAKGAPDGDVVSTDANYEFTFTENPTELYALFEPKPLTITLIPSDIEGNEVGEPIVFEIPGNTSVKDYMNAESRYDTYLEQLNRIAGYRALDEALYVTDKPMSNYSSMQDVINADDAIYDKNLTEDSTFYVPMEKLMKGFDVTVAAPVCGTEVSVASSGGRVHDGAKGLPEASIGSDTAEFYNKTYLVTEAAAGDYDHAFNGTIEGGKDYKVLIQLKHAFGWYFDEKAGADYITVNGKAADTVFETMDDADYHDMLATVKSDHDWGEWKVTKEPTTKEDGEEERVCKICGEKEKRSIAKIAEYTITYDLNGGTLDGETGKVSFKVEAGTVITLPEPTRKGYEFDYWKGSKYDAGDEYTVNGNHTFTAQWTAETTDSDKKKSKGVDTGDAAGLMGWLLLGIAAEAGAVYMYRRRRDEY